MKKERVEERELRVEVPRLCRRTDADMQSHWPGVSVTHHAVSCSAFLRAREALINSQSQIL